MLLKQKLIIKPDNELQHLFTYLFYKITDFFSVYSVKNNQMYFLKLSTTDTNEEKLN